MALIRKVGQSISTRNFGIGVVVFVVAVAAMRTMSQTAAILDYNTYLYLIGGSSSVCKNYDYKAVNQNAVFTFVNGENYIKGAAKLGRSIQRFTNSPVDLIALELENKPVSDWETLKKAGWQRCTVKRIPPRNEQKTYKRFRDTFTKLYVWTFDVYVNAVFVDSDALVVAPIDGLLNMDIKDKKIGATQDFFRNNWVNTFNSGVFKIHPNNTEFHRILDLHKNESKGLAYDIVQSDQGFLNAVYKDEWHENGFGYNANLAIWARNRPYWDEHKDSVAIIHYTLRKPWDCPAEYGEICSFWEQAP